MLIPSVRNLFLTVVNRIGVNPNIGVSADANSLTSIVSKWESLNNACIEAGLVDAQDRLHEVFLALAKNSADPKHDPIPPDEAGG